MIVTIEMLKPLLEPTVALAGVTLLGLLLKKSKNKKNSPLEKHSNWSRELLMSLEWKRYEEICKEFLIIAEKNKFNVNVTRMGADGGIDLQITDKRNRLIGIGQCKAYNYNSIVGVAFIRELFGVMASEKVTLGYFFTTSTFSDDAIEFAIKNKIILIDGQEQVKIIQSFKPEQRQKLFKIATDGDYTTPTCPNCNVKMVKRSSEKGEKTEFWGCSNYPKCRKTLNVRKN